MNSEPTIEEYCRALLRTDDFEGALRAIDNEIVMHEAAIRRANDLRVSILIKRSRQCNY